MDIKRVRGITLSVIASMFIVGCSVTPKPMLNSYIKDEANKNLEFLEQDMKKVDKAISIEEAIQRAIKYNRKNRLAIMESALSEQQLDMVFYDMLPGLTAKAGYSSRDNYAASSSTSFTNGSPDPIGANPVYSISQDKDRNTNSAEFSWNILDFGLSYVRAQQKSDKYLIAKEKERKVIHNITQEIRRAYYKTVSAEDLLQKTKPIMKEVREALLDSKKIQQLKVKSPLVALQYQRELMDILRTLYSLEKSLISSKVELASLMGLKPGTKFELSEKAKKSYAIPTVSYSVDDMEKLALENRPEIIQSMYQERISEKELTTAKLKMLPGINLNAGLYNDDNQYALNNDWVSYGATVSWNLLNVFKANQEDKIAKTKIAIAKEQKLALSMAVLSQVHLSYIRYQQAKKEYKLSNEYLNVAGQVLEQTKISMNLQTSSKLLLIKEKLNYLVATLRHSSSYANLQNSYGSIFVSLGIDEQSKAKEKIQEEKVETVPLHVEKKEEVKVQPKIEPTVEEKVTKVIIPVMEPKKELVVEPAKTLPTVEKVELDVKTQTEKFSSEFFNKNFSNAHILLKKGEVLNLKGEKYIVKDGDTISKLSVKYNLRIKTILMDNFWLAEQGRVRFRK